MRIRSRSSGAKTGFSATSAMIAMPGAILSDRLLRVTEEDSHPDPAFKAAPRASTCWAISGADRVLVPSVTREAVRSAAPASPDGSTSPPDLIVRLAVIRGRSLLCATITRRPLGRVISAGLGSTALIGAPMGGGAWRWPSGARAATSPVNGFEGVAGGGVSATAGALAGRADSGR